MLKHIANLHTLLSSLVLIILLAGVAGCQDSSQSQGVGWHPNVPFGTLPPGFESFPERWNKQIRDRLVREEAAKQKEIKELRDKFFKTEDPTVREKLQSKLISDEAALSALHRRQEEGDYIKFKTPADIPQDLVWENGLDNPEIGDPNAKKGGVLRLWAPGSYPDTFRPNGPNSNSGFRGPLYDEIIIGLVSIHPITGKIIPGIAHKWAESADRRTVFFELDPDARYTDGAKVKAIDLLVNMFIRTSEYSRDVFYNNFFYQNASNITIYDDSHLSVTLPFAKPLLPYYCTLFTPSPPHFYCEFGPNYVERYQWRVPPTTGAYVVKPDGIIRGRQVTLQRVTDWWAKNKKFTKYMYNVDQIVYNFIAEPSKAIELFRIGELDVLNITKPELWHERMEIPEVHNGYINRSTFYTIYPRPPYGIFLNTSKPPFHDLNMRLGFHHALNIQNIIDITFRGDYQRLNSYNSGFGKFSNPYIKARPYSPEQARAYFAKAGYTISCPDGILRKPDGTRLTAAITFPNTSPTLASTLSKLKEDARKCGLEIQLDPLDATVSFRKIMEKRAQASLMAWGFTPPHPMNEQGFHSRYAYDERGGLITYTNNITACADKDLDKLLDAETNAATEDELQKATWKVQQAIHDKALWVPCWTSEFIRLGYWRWVKWPNSATTQFCHPVIFEPTESYLYWVDNDIKEETLHAKRTGKTFDEVDVVYDQYRYIDSIKRLDNNNDANKLPSVPAIPDQDSQQKPTPSEQ